MNTTITINEEALVLGADMTIAVLKRKSKPQDVLEAVNDVLVPAIAAIDDEKFEAYLTEIRELRTSYEELKVPS